MKLKASKYDSTSQILFFSPNKERSISHVQHAKALLAVAEGKTFTQAARAAGYRVGDSVAKLVQRFNAQGVAAL